MTFETDQAILLCGTSLTQLAKAYAEVFRAEISRLMDSQKLILQTVMKLSMQMSSMSGNVTTFNQPVGNSISVNTIPSATNPNTISLGAVGVGATTSVGVGVKKGFDVSKFKQQSAAAITTSKSGNNDNSPTSGYTFKRETFIGSAEARLERRGGVEEEVEEEGGEGVEGPGDGYSASGLSVDED